MLTALTSETQPQSTQPELTSRAVTTLQQRLKRAMKNGDAEILPADLARACDISPSAVSKWFDNVKELKAAHVFAVAKLCKVDAEWLATGNGKPELPKPSGRAADIPDHRLALIRQYGQLPDAVRYHIRGLIQTLAIASSDRYAAWSLEMADAAKQRDELAVHEP